jgi:hypothetical protein
MAEAPHQKNMTLQELSPNLSVVVVVLEGSERLQSCLTALVPQTGAVRAEIIVPWDGSHGSAAELRSGFPGVDFLELTGRRTYAELRSAGVHRARGTVIAITEDHCTPAGDWCVRILEAHRTEAAAIGGTVEKETPDTSLNWAFYLADYIRYMNPATAGPSRHLTDCNVTYKRVALEAIRAVWAVEFHENQVHDALLALGETLWLEPRIVVRQKRLFSLHGAIRDRYAFGRLFGSTRAAPASIGRRMVYLAFSLPLPALLVWRVAGHVFRKRRCRWAFVLSLPALLLICTVWAWGEFAGYLTGRPEASLAVHGNEAAP